MLFSPDEEISKAQSLHPLQLYRHQRGFHLPSHHQWASHQLEVLTQKLVPLTQKGSRWLWHCSLQVQCQESWTKKVKLLLRSGVRNGHALGAHGSLGTHSALRYHVKTRRNSLHSTLIFRIKIFPKKSLTSSSRDMRSMLKIQAKTCMLLCYCNMFLQSTECRLLSASILFQGRGFAVSELLSLSFPV